MHYTKDHEWVKTHGNIATIGISDYAQEHLGDITYVDLPQVGKSFKAHDVIASVESVKAVSDIYAPVSGKVIEINEDLNSTPEVINESAEEKAWLAKLEMSNPNEVNELMNFDTYVRYIESLE